VGVGLADVRSSGGWVQGELLDDSRARARKLEEVIADIRQRHDGIPVTRASLLGRPTRLPPDPRP
jgi:hypothetical protein